MTRADADFLAEMPGAPPEGNGRKPQEEGDGASNSTATQAISGPEGCFLLEAVLEHDNMWSAYRRVVTNGGSPGIDGMTVEVLGPYLKVHWPRIKAELLTGTYRPQPVRTVEIPKPNGKGKRMLGIPTVVDRLIQQALHQVLSPIFEAGFSESSYGFRPGRGAHQAVLAARSYVASGKRWVVDLDLEKFFDTVNHDMLMSRVARKVEDKRVLRLIRRYLQAGLMADGVVSMRVEGTPQGGPLSPLLSNILLDDLDKELERRGHAFCRYADDCNIYVNSRRAGERVMETVTAFLEKRLKLKVNREKSAVARPWLRKFLGYSMTFHKQPRLKVAPESVARLKQKLRKHFRKGRGRNLAKLVRELIPLLRGWMVYFRHAEVKNVLEELDSWIRRKLRCVIWRQAKYAPTRAKMLMRQGLKEEQAWRSAYNGRGPWWNAGASHMNLAFPKAHFDSLGLVSLLTMQRQLQRSS